ncbi:Ppx/GppA family phosphatase [Kordiimonas sp.]|uniref:Ppx/GppA phosphatase family protein n=1 Tax=Kordiimonas sp. TaxID=1970157 RepID=UPI003A8E38E7
MSLDPREQPAGEASEGNGPNRPGPKEKASRRRRRRPRKRASERRENAGAPSASQAGSSKQAQAPNGTAPREGAAGIPAQPDTRQKKPADAPKPNNNRQFSSTAIRTPAPPVRTVYSAIDLGTNNCRLLIARPTRGGFRVIDAFSRIVRLGEGVSNGNMLSEAAMDRTIEALKVCAEKIARRNVTCMRHVATEACRVADNSAEFIARVKRETGLNLDIISAGEEARLAVMGCQSLIAPGNRHALVFDIGGGSTELIWVKVLPGGRTEISGWMSIPWGVVNLSEHYGVSGTTVPPEQYNRMVSIVVDHLQAFEDAHSVAAVVKKRQTQFLGTSGTVTTLASLHLNLPRYIREKVDGAWMKSKDIHALSRTVAEMTHEERSAQPCIGPERADLVVAGCAILEAILGMWNVPSLRVADRGIREGILRGMMQLETMPVRQGPRRRGRNAGGRRNKVKANG